MPRVPNSTRVGLVSLGVYVLGQGAHWLAALAVYLGAGIASMALAVAVSGVSVVGLTMWGLLQIVRSGLDGTADAPYRRRVVAAVVTLASLCVGPAVLGLAFVAGLPVWLPGLAEFLPGVLVPCTLVFLVLLPGLVRVQSRVS